MNGCVSFDTELSSYQPEKHDFNVRDANGQIVFSYGNESEPTNPNTFERPWEHKIDKIIGIIIISYYRVC